MKTSKKVFQSIVWHRMLVIIYFEINCIMKFSSWKEIRRPQIKVSKSWEQYLEFSLLPKIEKKISENSQELIKVFLKPVWKIYSWTTISLQHVWHKPLLHVSYLPIQVLKTSLGIKVFMIMKLDFLCFLCPKLCILYLCNLSCLIQSKYVLISQMKVFIIWLILHP